MNLRIEESEDYLWQTPTWITHICLSYNEKGQPDGGWEGVLRRYTLWVQSSSDGVWEDAEEMDAQHTLIRDHIAGLQDLVRAHTQLSFYLM